LATEAKGRRIGRRIDYIGHIRERLQDLSGFDTLAHELIQNAEDAHATRITFDVRQDALVIQNDAAFTDCGRAHEDPDCSWKKDGRPSCDWHNLTQIAAGQKRDRDDAIGKFGIGFIAVYQLTDRPEVISGRHWILEEDQPEADRIFECAGCAECSSVVGTKILLPYARDPDSTLRRGFSASAITDADLPGLSNSLAAAAPLALLFMNTLTSVEVLRAGKPFRRTNTLAETTGDGMPATLIDTDGRTQLWYLLSGSFAAEADALRLEHSADLIEPNRSAVVRVAIPATGETDGRLFAGLPTETTTGLPFHINAAFYPSTDRKRVIFGSNDYKSKWNQAALAAAAASLDLALVSLREPLGHLGLWTLILQISKASGQAAALVESLGLARFRGLVAARAKRSPVGFTASGRWVMTSEAPVLREAPKSRTVEVLATVGIDPMHPDIRSILQQGLVSNDFGTHHLTLDEVVTRLHYIGLGRVVSRDTAPAGLRSPEGLVGLWDEIERLLAMERSLGQHKGGAPSQLRDAAIAPCGDVLAPLDEAYRCDERARGLVDSLQLGVLVLDDEFAERASPLVDLCPDFGLAAFAGAGGALPAGAFNTRWQAGAYRPSDLLSWIGSRQVELQSDVPARRALRGLPAYPTAERLVPLDQAVLPGDFEGFPLGLTDLLVLPDLARHRTVLAALGVRQLSFVEYARTHVPRAMNGDLTTGVRRDVVAALARRVHELEQDEPTRVALTPVALVECTDGLFRPASDVVIESPSNVDILGDSIPLARPPAADGHAHERLWRWLGATDRPTADHVWTRIEAIIDDPPDGKAVAALEVVAEHLNGRLTEPDMRDLVGDLSDVAWLPARDNELEWFRPDAIYSVFTDYLFLSQGRFLAFRREVQNDINRPLLVELGVESEPLVALVVGHLLAWAAESREVNKAVWEFLRRSAKDPAIARLRGTACVWVDGAYRRPDEVFWDDHPFGSHRWKLDISLYIYKEFFDAIGVREAPTVDDVAAVLAETFEGAGGEALTTDEQTVVVGCWRLLAELVETEEAGIRRLRQVPSALDRDGRMVEPSRLYFEDRPRLTALFPPDVQGRIIAFDPETESALRLAGARDLGEALTVAKLDPGHPAPAVTLDRLIADRAHAIRRVIETVAEPDSAWALSLADLDRREVDGLRVRYELNDEPGHPATEPEMPDALFIADDNCLYVQVGDLPVFAVARELAVALSGPRSVGSVSPALATVLAATDAVAAHRALDELGFATIAEEVAFVPVPMATATGLGSDDADDGPTAESDDVDQSHEAESEEPETPPGPAGETPPTPGTTKPDKPGVRHPDGPGSQGGDRGEGEQGHPPGSGHPGNGKRHQKRDVLRSFVAAPDSDDDAADHDADDTDDEGPDINRAGVDAVLAYESEHGRFPEEMAHANPGFDILSRAADGEIDRYIEVKSRSDSWLDAQTALSPRQHRMALEKGEMYWLYVVERAALETREIHPIQDPIGRATRFGFDPGWIAVAGERETSTAPSSVRQDPADSA
jgi:hypothetical protein